MHLSKKELAATELLFSAIRRGDAARLDMALGQGANVDFFASSNPLPLPALALAAWYGRDRLTALLYKRGADLFNARLQLEIIARDPAGANGHQSRALNALKSLEAFGATAFLCVSSQRQGSNGSSPGVMPRIIHREIE